LIDNCNKKLTPEKHPKSFVDFGICGSAALRCALNPPVENPIALPYKPLLIEG